MSEEAHKAIMAGASTTAEVLAEVVYVLDGVYHAERQTISQTLDAFLSEVEVTHRNALRYAFRLYGAKNLDFVDCLLAGYHYMEGQDILTFDKKLHKVLLNDPLTE